MSNVIPFDPLHSARMAYLTAVLNEAAAGRLRPTDVLDEIVSVNAAIRQIVEAGVTANDS